MTTILALQGSPRGREGNTDIMLQEFLRGAASAGAQTETVYLKDLSINHCIGCFNCWTETPGKCIHEDDMPPLLEKVRRYDIMVHATPIYSFNMTPQLKTFQDRLLPLIDPHMIKVGDKYKHPSRYDRVYKTVLISNCGFPDIRQFEALRQTMRMREEFGNTVMIGELLMPTGEILKQKEIRELLGDYYAAFFSAGTEVVQHGRILPETEKKVQTLVMPQEDIVKIANEIWDKQQYP